jgi:flagellin
MNAHRQLMVSDAGLSKSLERLSSGYRINRAADDAAGLSISQQFRADIASYKVASRNASEASSLLQVAEGAMDQIGGMLTRLKELATQASSANAGSNVSKINAEGNKLIDEIDRIATSTEYAGTKLINGTFGVTATDSSTAYTAADLSSASGLVKSEEYTISAAAGSGSTINITVTTGDGSQTVNGVVDPTGSDTSEVYFSAFGLTLEFNSALDSATAGTLTGTSTGNSYFQIGAENESDNRVAVALGNVKGTDSTGLNLSKDQLNSASGAQAFLSTIDTAIGSLADTRGDIGANMNRLSYASANLASTIENVQAAESVIRDVDMAAEMTTFTKNQILLQAGTAMLAQANMSPQLVLSLFG